MQEISHKRRTFMARTAALVGAQAIGGALPVQALAAESDIASLSAVEAVSAMRAGDLKSETYAQALLERCAALKGLNVFLSQDREVVLESARNADRARANGKRLGAMHGLPVPVKDSINTRSLPTTSGTPALRNFRPAKDAPVARSLFDAGAILLGKTNLHELSFGWTTNNLAYGPTRNPYDTNRIPGGSSGGTAVAIATSMAPVGLAEDTCGSIRVPAAFCGIKGFRPSTFRWSTAGVMPLTSVFDTVGPHARSVGDLALVDSVVTGDMKAITAPSLKGIRLGVIRDYFYADLDPEVERVTEDALRLLRSAGVVLVEGSIPGLVENWQVATFPIFQHETRLAISEYLKDYDTGVTWEELLEKASDDIKQSFGLFVVEGGKFRSTKAVYEESRRTHRPALQNAFRRYFRESGVSAIVHPTVMVPPPRIGQEGDIEVSGKSIPFYVAMSRNIAPGSTVGIPGLVLPAGSTTEGLPVGLEFDAPVGRDRDLLALGLALETVLPRVAPPRI